MEQTLPKALPGCGKKWSFHTLSRNHLKLLQCKRFRSSTRSLTSTFSRILYASEIVTSFLVNISIKNKNFTNNKNNCAFHVTSPIKQIISIHYHVRFSVNSAIKPTRCSFVEVKLPFVHPNFCYSQ